MHVGATQCHWRGVVATLGHLQVPAGVPGHEGVQAMGMAERVGQPHQGGRERPRGRRNHHRRQRPEPGRRHHRAESAASRRHAQASVSRRPSSSAAGCCTSPRGGGTLPMCGADCSGPRDHQGMACDHQRALVTSNGTRARRHRGEGGCRLAALIRSHSIPESAPPRRRRQATPETSVLPPGISTRTAAQTSRASSTNARFAGDR